jgi:hypothetical protein
MSKTIQSTLEFIDIVDGALSIAYDTVFEKTRKVLEESTLDKHDRSHLEWGLAHMHTSLGEFHRDLARHKKTLLEHMKKELDAGRTI